jgi:hypothetical protein
MSTYATAADAARALERFVAAFRAQEAVTIRRSLGATRARGVSAFRSRGIGRRMFAKNPGAAGRYIKTQPLREAAGSITGGLLVVGMAALQEEGGTTKRHIIRPKGRRYLVFQARQADARNRDGLTFARQVQHPGSHLRKLPLITQAFMASEPMLAADMDRTMQATADRVVG